MQKRTKIVVGSALAVLVLIGAGAGIVWWVYNYRDKGPQDRAVYVKNFDTRQGIYERHRNISAGIQKRIAESPSFEEAKKATLEQKEINRQTETLNNLLDHGTENQQAPAASSSTLPASLISQLPPTPTELKKTCVGKTCKVEFPVNQDWVNTGILVPAGVIPKFKTLGGLVMCRSNVVAGPEGQIDSVANVIPPVTVLGALADQFPVKSAGNCSLVARLDNGEGVGVAGPQKRDLTPTPVPTCLYLRVNDLLDWTADDRGSFPVEVTIE